MAETCRRLHRCNSAIAGFSDKFVYEVTVLSETTPFNSDNIHALTNKFS
jgi:hypothetical protein